MVIHYTFDIPTSHWGIYCHRRRIGYFKSTAVLVNSAIASSTDHYAYFIGAAGVVVLNIEVVPQVTFIGVLPLRQQPVALSGQPS